MAKSYCYSILRHQAIFFFTPLRKKNDVLKVLLEAIKVMIIKSPCDFKGDEKEYFCLNISKMSRLTFVSEEKVYSINFPFKVLENSSNLEFLTSNDTVIDSYLTSEAKAFLSDDGIVGSSDFLEFTAPLVESDADGIEYWALIKELFFYEDGYIRYDYDQKNQNGHFHPVNHFDLFYSSSATFKIGLEKRYYFNNIIDLLDVTTACHYLNSNGLKD